MYPCDEVCLCCSHPKGKVMANSRLAQEEKDRMDMYHKILEVARRHKLHDAPIVPHSAEPPRILDLGCGTGIWAIDMAEYVPSLQILPTFLVPGTWLTQFLFQPLPERRGMLTRCWNWPLAGGSIDLRNFRSSDLT